MEEFIHKENLERYQKMLTEKTHEPQRLTILRLLAEEIDALSQARFARRHQTPAGSHWMMREMS